MISSQPSEQYGFTTLFLFLLFLNSDIGIVILYIVKYIRKAFSLPKKINFEVQNLTNIHVFRFAFSDLYCYHTDLQNARNAVSDNLIFKISRGGMPPDPPSKSRLRGSKWALSRPYCQYSELCHARAYKQKKARNAPDVSRSHPQSHEKDSD